MSGIIWCRFNISVLVQLSTALICYVWSICDDNFMLSKFLPWFFSLEPKIYNITKKIPQIHSVHNFWTIPKHNNALMKGVEKPQAWQNFVWLDGISPEHKRREWRKLNSGSMSRKGTSWYPVQDQKSQTTDVMGWTGNPFCDDSKFMFVLDSK